MFETAPNIAGGIFYLRFAYTREAPNLNCYFSVSKTVVPERYGVRFDVWGSWFWTGSVGVERCAVRSVGGCDSG